MAYKQVLKNECSLINLHDCQIKNLAYENGSFHIYFPDGFFMDGEKRTAKNAKIIIEKLCVEDATFIVSKPYRLIKGKMPIYITKYKYIKDLRKLFDKGYYFTIIKEYYVNGEIVWKGVIESFKNHTIKNYGVFEFSFYSENLTYCFDEPD